MYGQLHRLKETAALDIGANNLVACTTPIGEQHLYDGRELS